MGTCGAPLTLPVVYAGLVTNATIAAQVLADGHADVVGLNRATIADPDLPAKARADVSGKSAPASVLTTASTGSSSTGCRSVALSIRARGVNSRTRPSAAKPRRILVVGAGPAGMETAAISAERGHDVTLWEQAAELGGQMALAARTPIHAGFARFITFQQGRLERLKVAVQLGRRGDVDDIASFGADAVVLATGAPARIPRIPGVELPFVYGMDDVLTGAARPAGRVAVIAQHDHIPPLAVADFLVSELGARVVIIHQSMAPAPDVGKYTIGAVLHRLLGAGTEFVAMSRVVGIDAGVVHTQDIFAGTPKDITGVDAVVLACGRRPDPSLRRALDGVVPELHVLGDAYAPRRITMATRQAWALAGQL